MEHTGITIVLELDEAADCPSGRARLLGGPPRAFHGWLGLSEAIDALMRSSASVAETSHADPEEVEGAST